MPAFSGIDHLAITVSDLDSSESFYERLWGMPAAGGLTGESLRRRLFRLPDGKTFGLTEHDRGTDSTFSPFVPGMDHVGFGVESVAELQRWVEHLDAAGIEHSGIVEADYGFALSVKDPDNTALEFFVRK